MSFLIIKLLYKFIFISSKRANYKYYRLGKIKLYNRQFKNINKCTLKRSFTLIYNPKTEIFKIEYQCINFILLISVKNILKINL